ncbi:MAG: hypothetical protein ABIN01_16775 [Ferruginibacter sp.]
MYQLIKKNKKIIGGIAACLLIGGITMSFQNIPFGPLDKVDSLTDVQDTIPDKPKDNETKMTIKDFDRLVLNMDNESLKIQKEISKIDFDKIHHEITNSLNKVDFDKIKIDIDKAINQIDIVKIENSIKSALKEIDWDKMNSELKISLQNAKKEIEKVKMTELKTQLEKAKLELEKSKNEIKKINVDEIINKAHSGIANAKDELRLTKQMFNEMEKDGLINQKEGFTIEYKNKTLFINGKKQNEKITNKYEQYIKGDSFKISISKE